MRGASNVPLQLAGCSLVIFPTLAMFIIFKDKFIGSLSIGGLKG
jgi:ABC-type glycerol-3-phosphate transport system permease component